jgi:hypothetical protein
LNAALAIAILHLISQVQDTLKKFDAFECEIWDVELQWNNNKKCVIDTTRNLLVKVERGGGGKKAVDCTGSA